MPELAPLPPASGRRVLVVEDEYLAAEDLRKTGKVTGELVFTVDESATALTVDAEVAPQGD